MEIQKRLTRKSRFLIQLEVNQRTEEMKKLYQQSKRLPLEHFPQGYSRVTLLQDAYARRRGG